MKKSKSNIQGIVGPVTPRGPTAKVLALPIGEEKEAPPPEQDIINAQQEEECMEEKLDEVEDEVVCALLSLCRTCLKAKVRS